MGSTPCYSQSQAVSVCQSFRPITKKIFPPAKYLFFFFLLSKEKRCGHINMLKTFHGDTDHKYIWVVI